MVKAGAGFMQPSLLNNGNVRSLFFAFLTSIIFIFLLCFFFEPRWETNDDVGISMAAHGYGVAAVGLPNLIFSNVLWGYLVRAIPEINGILGYSIATLSVLATVGTMILYVLSRFGAGPLLSFLTLVLLLVRPVLFPQFTVNAGLLMLAAIVSWCLYAQKYNIGLIVLGCMLAFCSFLIRKEEFLLVLIVGLPLLPWRSFFLSRASKVAFITFAIMIILAMGIDYQAYQGSEWYAFKEFNTVAKFFTDFGAGHYLKQRPDILAKYGYTANDIDLLSNWFFIDPRISNPIKLKAMLIELGPLWQQSGAFINGWVGIKALWSFTLLPLVFSAISLTVFYPSRRVMASWIICIIAVFVLGLMGRPGILRVYVPLISLLLIASFLRPNMLRCFPKRLCTVVIFLTCIVNAGLVFSDAKTAQMSIARVRNSLEDFPKGMLFCWGAELPFESIYPVLHSTSSRIKYPQLYSLGGFALAPFTVSFTESAKGRDLSKRLTDKGGISMIAHEYSIGLLKVYCQEHLNCNLKKLATRNYGVFEMSQWICEKK